MFNDSQKLEAEAYKKGQEFVSNNGKSEAKNISKVGKSTNSGVIQTFKMGSADQSTYNKFKTFVQKEMRKNIMILVS